MLGVRLLKLSMAECWWFQLAVKGLGYWSYLWWRDCGL